MCRSTESAPLSFRSTIGSIWVTIEYTVEDGFLNLIRCVKGEDSASLLDDGNYFSAAHMALWKGEAEANYKSRQGADFEPDPTDVFRDPAGSATRAIASYFHLADANAKAVSA